MDVTLSELEQHLWGGAVRLKDMVLLPAPIYRKCET